MNFIKNLFVKKEAPIKNYADFWNWFKDNQEEFHKIINEGNKIQSHFFKKLSPKLNEIRKGYFFVTGMLDDTTAELIITADGNLKNIVFVEELVQAAPEIKGWRFTALKPQTDIKNKSIVMEGYSFNKENLSFFSKIDLNNPDEIDITIVYKNFNEMDVKTINIGTFLFIDNFIGELNSVTLIDTIKIIGNKEISEELIPIEKLNNFLVWREKEFIEKYESIKHSTDNDTYVILEAELKDGKPIVAMMNSELLKWNEKPSYQWILNINLTFDGSSNNGLPNDSTMKLLNNFEDYLSEFLNDGNGQLNIGRETADGIRTIYFACKDFRHPTKIMDQIIRKYEGEIDLDFEIFKDKYWTSLNYYINSLSN